MDQPEASMKYRKAGNKKEMQTLELSEKIDILLIDKRGIMNFQNLTIQKTGFLKNGKTRYDVFEIKRLNNGVQHDSEKPYDSKQ